MASRARSSALSRPPPKSTNLALTADQLAKDLDDKLTINNDKGKRKGREESDPEARKLASMRAVNGASQTLSNVAQSGWKKLTGGTMSRTTLNTVASSTAEAAKHLGVLRRISSGDVDVERAALSVLGKLLVLEMYDLAVSVLEGMHPRICLAIVGSEEHQSADPSKLYLLSIPKAASPPSNPTLLNLLSTYLLYALMLVSRPESSTPSSVQQLSTTLDSPSTFSLLSWLPDCSLLPSKHLDSLLTRAYTALTKLCNPSTPLKKPPLRPKSTDLPISTPSPEALFRLQVYALRCLAHTSTGVIEGKIFWDQITKFTSVLVKATPSASSSTTEESVTTLVLHSFDQLVQIAETRPDKGSFMAVDENGKNFIAFCDYWSSFAKRAGDISLLQRINMLIQKSNPSFIPFNVTTPSPQKQVEVGSSTESPQRTLIIDGTRLCNTFAQLSLLLEDLLKTGVGRAEENDDQLLSLIQICISSFEDPSNMSLFLRPICSKPTPPSAAVELARICAKVDRAVEKVRRVASKVIDVYTSSPTSLPSTFAKANELLHSLLHACVACLQVVLLDSSLDAPAIRDILHRSIDTLFVMARVTLKVTDPRTFIPAFELLAEATSILDSVPVGDSPSWEESLDIANYTRCVSGAFYNLASILYQGTRYGNAVPFLFESCKLGGRALSLPRSSSESTTETRRKEWVQLEEQLYRRWELLGVCYSKNSDRRKAFDAFKQAIDTFPFSSTGLLEQTETLTLNTLFGPECNTAVKQLVGLVDRVTYMGTCELFLTSEAISFRSCMQNGNGVPNGSFRLENGITGALLERQLVSLEPSRWKEGVRDVFIGLLRDAIEIYCVQGEDGSLLMPIRKARILCRCLEFAYRDSAVDGISSLGYGTPEEIATEVERLCTLQSFAKDSSLAHLSLQYRATAQLWVALHAHRRADPEQNTIMTQRSEEACRLMKMILASDVVGSPKASRGPTSPKLVRKSAGSVGVGRIVSPKTTRTNRLRVPSAPRKPVPVRKTKTKVVGDSNVVKPKTKLAAPVTATNAVRRSLDGKTSAPKLIIFDNFDEFLRLLQLVARILGLLSLVLAKAHILDMARKLAQRHGGTESDGYILASLDLAHVYATLGKLKRAVSIFSPAHEIVNSRQASREVSVRFLLRFGESLAIFEDIPKSLEVYLEAQGLFQHLDLEEKGMSTRDRVVARVKNLEITATAAHVFATIQFAQGDVCASLGNSLQALRLWNRAIDTITRLRPSISSAPDDNPFEMKSLQNALPSTGQSNATPNESRHNPPSSNLLGRSAACDQEWGLSEGLLSTLFFLSETYFLRGSAREAEYFARQAAELAEQLNAPAMMSRALAKLGEVQLHMGRFEDAHSSLTGAADRLQGMPGLDAADIRRLKMEYRMKTSDGEEPTELFEETVRMLEDLDDAFQQFDSVAFGPRRSLGSSPGRKILVDVLAPALLSSILSQQLWLLRNDIGDRFDSILERFLSLSFSNATKAEENALMANLTLHSVYGRFRTDMFLSSLTESTIAVPIGMKSKDQSRSSVSSVDILDALVKAEKHLSAHLHMSASTGSIIKIRETVISLALVYAFGTSLGDRREDLPLVIASLLDASACLTLRHDMLDAIDHKFPPIRLPGELQWPSLQTNETPPPPAPLPTRMRMNSSLSESEDDNEDDEEDPFVKDYWQSLRRKYKAQILDPCLLSSPETATLPNNWTVVNVSVTPDKGTLFCCRREGGNDSTQPLIFCIPLKERREHGAGDGEGDHLTFDGALSELQDIIHSSNESTKVAIHIKSDDESARSNWWKQRSQLDVRMRELLENIEYCWLGAFKTIFSPRSETPAEMISALREQFEQVFHQNLRMKDRKAAKPKHRKCTSQTHVPGQFRLDEAFVRCFSTLSPKCRDEELEDIVYFVLDLYQYHGVPVAVSEVDIDQLVVDLRAVLEEYAPKQHKQRSLPSRSDDHLFLILDKNVQGIPWESLPILRGRSVSRIPGVQFLHDRILFAQRKREAAGRKHNPVDGAVVDHRKGFFILNPSGDLSKTEDRFRDWASGMRAAGWDGITGQPITEQQFIDALRTKDLVIYFGHGGGEQYVRSHRIRNLPTCAATMLWGCSSGVLRDLGDFDRTGTPYNYMLAGCPTLVANLWDVTDKDIDKLCQSVLNKMSLNGPDIARQSVKRTRQPTSLVSAVAESRDSCKLKYLTGAAPVVYGIPFYL